MQQIESNLLIVLNKLIITIIAVCVPPLYKQDPWEPSKKCCPQHF